jgi:ribosomal protein L11 methyltransferase
MGVSSLGAQLRRGRMYLRLSQLHKLEILFSLLLHPLPDREDFLVAELQECGTAGLAEEEGGGLRAFFETDEDAGALARRFAEFAPELRHEQATDWERVTQDAWPPLCVGERFYLVAPWDNVGPAAVPTPPGRLRLEIHPGMACGTGRHPATQLCLRAIEHYVRPGDRVLDVGSGSGILSEAARLMGADRVVGCDIDPAAVQIARERLRTPAPNGRVQEMFIGSIDAVRSQWASVIIANIDAATLESMAQELARVRSPESTLILSGFPESDVPDGFSPKEVLRLEEWCCFVC